MWDRKRMKVGLGVGAMAVVLSAAVALATQNGPDPSMMQPVQQWIDGFNSGTGPLSEDVFTDDVVITDEFPPYVWIGKSAEHQWARAIDAFIKPGNHHLSVGAAQSFQAGKDRVTFVLPATLTLTAARTGNLVTEHALWLFVLVRDGNEWRIAADTWTKSE